MALVKQVGSHGRRGGFAMCARHAKSFHRPCERAQHLSSLLKVKSIALEILELGMLSRNSRGINHKTRIGIETFHRYEPYIFLVMNVGTLFFKMSGQWTGCAVVTTHN